MTARILIRPPARACAGARQLRTVLPQELVRLSRAAQVPRQYRLVINWGNSQVLQAGNRQLVLNSPEAVSCAIDKLAAFTRMREADVKVPDFTTDASSVNLGSSIYLCRLSATGSGGEGIVVLRKGDEIPPAPLYVRYIPKIEEYRIHVFCGAVIHVQQKRRRNGIEQSADERLIRSHDNGWVFCNVGIGDASPLVKAEAVKAVEALGLDFAAVDCIRGRDDGIVYVLECNTAPGLDSPTSINAYATAILEEYERGQSSSNN